MNLLKKLTAVTLISLAGASALLAPVAASAAPRHGHQECHWNHHHKVCHWVR